MDTIIVKLKKHLNADSLIQSVRKCFEKVEKTVKFNSQKSYPFADALMSAFAVFSIKCPSLLAFESHLLSGPNLNNIYKIEKSLSDTHMREILDEVDPKLFAPVFKKIFSQLQRGNELKKMRFLGGFYLVSVDGTGYFSSSNIHCDSCLEKKHKNGKVTYHHQMLGAAIVHPAQKEVIPLLPEPIIKQDGETKNDCERNAAKRFLRQLKKDHPHLPIIIIEDGLASNAPHILELKSHDFRFILGAKKGDHAFLFDHIDRAEQTGQVSKFEMTDENGIIHRFRFINDVPLNETNQDLSINFVEYWEFKPNGRQQHFSWVTDILINEENVYDIMRGGRARWKIENETFNTLKNQEYHFEHNFGHGKKNLSVVFAFSMMLAFLVDQAQQMSCELFQLVWKTASSKRLLWEMQRSVFWFSDSDSIASIFKAILSKYKIQVIFSTNTS